MRHQELQTRRGIFLPLQRPTSNVGSMSCCNPTYRWPKLKNPSPKARASSENWKNSSRSPRVSPLRAVLPIILLLSSPRSSPTEHISLPHNSRAHSSAPLEPENNIIIGVLCPKCSLFRPPAASTSLSLARASEHTKSACCLSVTLAKCTVQYCSSTSVQPSLLTCAGPSH